MKSGSLFLVIFVTIFTTTNSFTKHVSFSSLVGLYQWSQAHILNHWDPRQPLKPPDHWDIVIMSSQINENTSTNSPRFRVRWISQRSRGRGRFLETFLFFFNLSDLGIPGCPLQLFKADIYFGQIIRLTMNWIVPQPWSLMWVCLMSEFSPEFCSETSFVMTM